MQEGLLPEVCSACEWPDTVFDHILGSEKVAARCICSALSYIVCMECAKKSHKTVGL